MVTLHHYLPRTTVRRFFSISSFFNSLVEQSALKHERILFAEERTLSGGTTKFMKNLINVVRVQGSKPFPWVTDGDDYVAQLAKAMNGDKSSAWLYLSHLLSIKDPYIFSVQEMNRR